MTQLLSIYPFLFALFLMIIAAYIFSLHYSILLKSFVHLSLSSKINQRKKGKYWFQQNTFYNLEAEP